MKTCTVDGCDKQHRARGLCVTHYNQAHAPNRHAARLVQCAACGADVMKMGGGGSARRPVCSERCRYRVTYGIWPEDRKPPPPKAPRPPKKTREPKPRKPPIDMRSPLRRAIEDGTGADVIAAIAPDCTITPGGCWEWQRQSSDGYPVAIVAGRYKRIHRLALEARLGASLGKQPAHHMCANSLCVNPDHLQPVTHHDNVAEMMARKYMESRIRDLERALAIHEPTHPLLGEVGISLAG